MRKLYQMVQKGWNSKHPFISISQPSSSAEKAVQEVKNLLTRVAEAGEDFENAYSEYKMAPTSTGVSPAQLFFGCQVRSCILPQLLNTPDINQKAKNRINCGEENRFIRFRKHSLPLLARDQKVWLRNRVTKKWNIPAEVRG